VVDLTARLRAAADDAGLDGFGVCSVEPFRRVESAIAESVAAGRHAGMAFTFRRPEIATDVRASFPWAAALVSGACAYVPPVAEPGPPSSLTGRVARFATADHYEPLREGLTRLADLLRTEGFRAEVLVDDNRLVDRAAAVRAGIGWWGKSTMVITPRHGPWLLLGGVVTDAAAQPTPPMIRDCGTCDACLPACPTGALIEPGVLDARLCLAYRAQAPGSFPPELREAMGDRVYGCDDCLDACPPGRWADDAAAGGRGPAGRVGLIEMLEADDEDLLARYGHWYIPRRDPRYLRRNALVALGNTGDPGGVRVATRYLADPDPMLRGHAAWALCRLGGGAVRAALESAAGRESDPEALAEIQAALGSLA
jgi:epoxyqueuosine reductase